MLALSVGPSLGWTSGWTLGGFVASALATALFIYRLQHAANPLIPAFYFRRRNFVMPMVLRATCQLRVLRSVFPVSSADGARLWLLDPPRRRPRHRASLDLRDLFTHRGIRGDSGGRARECRRGRSVPDHVARALRLAPSKFGRVEVAIALALSGLGMGVALPSSSSVMANEVKVSEFGVMSAAQLLAMQVGEVAGIQVLETVQQSIARRRGLSHAHRRPGAARDLSHFLCHWRTRRGGGPRRGLIHACRTSFALKAAVSAPGSLEPYDRLLLGAEPFSHRGGPWGSWFFTVSPAIPPRCFDRDPGRRQGIHRRTTPPARSRHHDRGHDHHDLGGLDGERRSGL